MTPVAPIIPTTAEAFVRRMIREGKDEELLIGFLGILPEGPLKQKLRDVWRDEKGLKKKGPSPSNSLEPQKIPLLIADER